MQFEMAQNIIMSSLWEIGGTNQREVILLIELQTSSQRHNIYTVTFKNFFNQFNHIYLPLFLWLLCYTSLEK